MARFLAQSGCNFATEKKNNIDYTKGGDQNVRDYRRHTDHLADYKNWRTQRMDGNQSLRLIEFYK